LYPNPSKGDLKLRITGARVNEKVSIGIYNLLGAAVYKSEFNLSKNQVTENIDLTDLYEGTYLVKLQYGDKIETRKIVISK
jgi:hypothetical protein